MIELVPAVATQKALLGQLLELHLHDLSEFTGDAIGTDGRFGYRFLDAYWQEPGREPFLIMDNGEIAGFVLVRSNIPSVVEPGRTVHQVAEFFILRKFRRRGYGRQAARMTFERFPGCWEVCQVHGHHTARAFWLNVIEDFTGGKLTQHDLNNPAWHGSVQSFCHPAEHIPKYP